jgi:hypothetical protein
MNDEQQAGLAGTQLSSVEAGQLAAQRQVAANDAAPPSDAPRAAADEPGHEVEQRVALQSVTQGRSAPHPGSNGESRPVFRSSLPPTSVLEEEFARNDVLSVEQSARRAKLIRIVRVLVVCFAVFDLLVLWRYL